MPGRFFLAPTAVAATALVFAASPAVADEGADRPNILFAISDDQSYPHAGAYGTDWVQTPGFDRVAEEGILFTRAYTPNAKCAPSRLCILTGRNSWQLGAGANHVPILPGDYKAFPVALEENGYFVGHTGKGWGPGRAGRPMVGKDFGGDHTKALEKFLEKRPDDKPFFFWYGAHEPHRGYRYKSGVESGKARSDIDRVPAYWPDTKKVRNDMLDYAVEVEQFDKRLVRMLDMLEAAGELGDTLVVVTSDHGMPFPRVKGQAYDAANHVPLAIMWPEGIANPGRTVDDYVSFIDFAPTFLAVAGVDWREAGMSPTPGKPLTDIFESSESGQVNPERDHVLIGKERHDIGRPYNWGYPIRGIHKDNMLYLRNFKPERWPVGNPETGYPNCDGSPTKTVVLNTRTDAQNRHYWRWCFGKRPAEELYNVEKDPDCVNNLADDPAYAEKKRALKAQLYRELKAQEDPRMFGRGHVFDEYRYAQKRYRNFYRKFIRGDLDVPGWINASDIARDRRPHWGPPEK